MSNSIVPKVEGSTFNSDTSNKGVRSGVLHITPDYTPRYTIAQALVPIYGSSPEDAPCLRVAHLSGDTRTLAALTLRFMSPETGGTLILRQRSLSVSTAIWDALKAHLADTKCTLPRDLPAITFDEIDCRGVIDLGFKSFDAFQSVRKSFSSIKVEGQACHYPLTCFTTTVPGNIFRIDCINLALDNVDAEALFLAIKRMTSSIGSLLGVSKLVVHCSNLDGPSYCGVVRCFVKLHRPWLSAQARELALQIPTHFLWHGKPHTLLYAGHDCHGQVKHSADYPLSNSMGSEDSTAASTSDTNVKEASNTSNKRKATEA